jgi:hypothetical protein
MSRKLFIYRNGDWLEIDRHAPRPKRLIVIGDSLPETMNPMNGRRYTSKSRYYADTRAMGGEIVGNDPAGTRERVPVKPNIEPAARTVKRVIEQLGGK